MTTVTPHPSVDYARFGAWFGDYRSTVLEPALELALPALRDLLADQLSSRDQTRIRATSGRVKSKPRTWRKVRHSRFRDLIQSVDDIPVAVHDLVGMRVTCVNLRDNELVQSALDALPTKAGQVGQLWLQPDSVRDYVNEPKESGYRAWHVSLGMTVPGDPDPVPVTVELQVRTLLQDSWGELTHEDTYSKDGALPPLVEVLSSRMSDLLATLDDIAEDLRTELDRIDAAAVADTDPLNGDLPASAESEQADEAAAFLVDQWTQLERPVELATLAWALQRDFGAEITDEWFGHRTFKRFLLTALPQAEISSGRQGFLLPKGFATDVEEADSSGTDDTEPDSAVGGDPAPPSEVPGAARQLHRIDRSFPLLASEQWADMYQYLSAAWQRFGPQSAGPRSLNRLSQSAKDRADAAGVTLSRRYLEYLAAAVIPNDERGRPLEPDEIGVAFTEFVLERMVELRVLGRDHTRARGKVERWLGPS